MTRKETNVKSNIYEMRDYWLEQSCPTGGLRPRARCGFQPLFMWPSKA